MDFGSYLKKDQIIFLKNTEKQLVIKEMAEKLEEIGKIKNSLRYYTQIIYRESLENTGIGKSLAIPHARTESVDDIVFLFGISKDGIDYQSFDKKPVHFILLSIFPTFQSTTYLYMISMFAKSIMNETKLSSLTNATTATQVHKILQSSSKEYYDNINEKDEIKLEPSAQLAGVPNSDLELLIRLNYLYDLYQSEKTAQIKEKIEKLSSLIDRRSVSYYERMRNKMQNPFAFLDKNACSGCHMQIPPIELAEIKDRKKIALCSSCGRFLIFV